MPKKTIRGTVTSTKMNDTAVVTIEQFITHPVYKKRIKRKKRFFARDELGVKIGDEVIIEECPPFSKYVAFKVIEKVDKKEEK